MMQAAAYGRLGGDPREIATRTGTKMAVASIAVDLDDGRGDGDAGPFWLNIIAFGRVADTLLRHSCGDLLSASGRLQINRYIARDGSEREQLQLVADSIVSARSVRPGGGRKRRDAAPAAELADDPLSDCADWQAP